MQYLYLNNMYCSKSDDVKKMLSDRANQMNKDFRKEVLALFRDGVLDNWFSEISSLDKTALDDNLFVDLVQTITGNTVSGDIRSKFNDVGELVRVEFGDESYDIANGVVNINNFKPGNIKFIFKCLRPENNEFSFNYYNQTKKLNWNDYARNQEIALEFYNHTEGDFELKEGNGNVIVEIELKEMPPIPKGAVDLGLSVYWADRNVGAITPHSLGNMVYNGNVKELLKELEEGWRLPTEKEVRELNKCKKTLSLDLSSVKSNVLGVGFLFGINMESNTPTNKPIRILSIEANNVKIEIPQGHYLMGNEEGSFYIDTNITISSNNNRRKYIRPVYDKNN